MKQILILLSLILAPFIVNAQQSTVVYDYANNWFNQGGELPAETNFTITGQIPTDVSKVAIAIRKSGKENALYETEWSRPIGNTATSVSIPVKQKLRSNNLYDFDLKFYRLTEQADKKNIKEQLFTALEGYVDGIANVNKNKITLSKSTQVIMDDLFAIVDQSMVYYEPITGFDFPGFSDIVRLKLDQVDNTQLSIAKVNVGKQGNKANTQKAFADQLLGELKKLLRNEVSPYVMQDAYVLSEIRNVTEVETEKTTNYLTLQGGYGIIYIDGELSDANYFEGAYAGLVLPLGKPAFAPKFIQRASISAGVFLKNFEDTNGETVSGPIVGRPVYIGLGYNLIKFVKFNAGAVFLENKSTDETFTLDVNNIRVRPFVGLSAQIKLSGKLDF